MAIVVALTVIGAILGLASAFAALWASFLAGPIRPGYAQKLKAIVDGLEPLLESQRKFLEHLLVIFKPGATPLATSDHELLAIYAANARKTEVAITESKLLDFSAEEESNAHVRVWLIRSIVLSAFAAAFQVAALIAQVYLAVQ